MNLAELLLGQLPEAIYFAVFMILTKQLKTKRILFIIISILEYILIFNTLAFNIWAQLLYMCMLYIALKILYKEQVQITDIFTFGIASIIMIVISAVVYGITRGNMIYGSIISRLGLFLVLIVFRNKLVNIQKLYKSLWNRNDKIPHKMKSTTFRSLNLVIFNIMFYVTNLGILYALISKK